LHPSDVGGSEDPEWAWWLGGAFVHEVGIGLVIFGVSVCGAPRFLAGVVGGISYGPQIYVVFSSLQSRRGIHTYTLLIASPIKG